MIVQPRRRTITLALVSLSLALASIACSGSTDPSGPASVDTTDSGDRGADADTGGPSDETSPSSDDGVDTDGIDTAPKPTDTGPTSTLDPPAGKTSGGSGGGAAKGTVLTTGSGITYRLIAPGSSASQPLMIVFSGTEGGANMTMNLQSAAPSTGCGAFIFAVLDGTTYYGKGSAGADVLDEVRKSYDVDNDRTYLLGESAGTSAALQLGFSLRQSYFAAYWANDVNNRATPSKNASALGFAPFGNAGPGGDFADANAIVSAMKAAGYQTPPPAPYSGPGADTHGAPAQFLAALKWFPGKARK